MFSITSGKGIAIIAGFTGVIVLVMLASFSVFSYPQSSNNVNNPTTTNNQSSIFYVDRCYEMPSLSIVNMQGFETVKSRNGVNEFVLKPDSTGYIYAAYDFCPDWTKTGDKLPAYHNSTKEIAEILNPMNYDIFKFKEKAPESDNATRSDPLGSMATPSEDPIARLGTVIHSENLTGIEISVSNITRIDDQSVKATFIISADNDAERGTYGISFVGTCVGEILTIGDVPNENSMALEMVKGPFYGCSS